MIQYLIKNSVTVRVTDKEEADNLHKKIMEETLQNGWILSSWTEKHKERKQKNEIVDEWMTITYTIIFQEEKEPEQALKNITYDFYNNYAGDVVE